MSNNRKYDDCFKQGVVNLYHSNKTQSPFPKEYGVSTSVLEKWIKQYSEVQIDQDTVLTVTQIRKVKRGLALLKLKLFFCVIIVLTLVLVEGTI